MEVREPNAKYLARSGDKQTELGVIPEDWDAAILPSIIWFQEGPGLRNWQFRPRGLKVINVTNLQETGYLDLSKTERHISWEEFERIYKHFLIDDGDVVMASSGNSYCKTSIVREIDLPLLMNTSVIRFKPKERVGRSFMLIYLKSKYFKDQIDLMITGGAQPNFGPAHLNKVFVPLPPTKSEQEAIAEALSDADALIESLEQLLAKKCNIKQGAMQELLAGKKRLPGFSGEWEVKRLVQLADIRSGGTPSTTQPQFWDGDILWGTPTDITALNGRKYLFDTSRKITLYGLKSSSAEVIPANSIVMTSRATIGECAINRLPVTTNQGFKNFVPFENVDVEFLYYLLLTQKQGFVSLCGGSTFLEIGKAQLAAFEVRLPATKVEQTAIAAILSDIDAEITALEAKLAKARSLKQGMMQELLTGRIRLV